jgi:hypothetical protein
LTFAPTLAIWENVPLVPVFRSIKNPVSLLELSIHESLISAAPAWLIHPAADVKKKAIIAMRIRFQLMLRVIDLSFTR